MPSQDNSLKAALIRAGIPAANAEEIASRVVSMNDPNYVGSLQVGGKALAGKFNMGLQAGFSVWSGSIDAGSNGTVQVQWNLPAGFNGVRMVYTNYSTSPTTLSGARVAVTTNLADQGGGLTWTEATFAGVTAVAVPQVIPGATGAPPNEISPHIVSDPIVIQSLDSNNLILTRSDYTAAFNCTDPGGGTMAVWNNNNPFGYQFHSNASAGVVSNVTNITMPATGRSISPDALLVNYNVPSSFVMGVGGSHIRGDTTFGDHTGFVYRACMLKTQLARGAAVWSPFNGSRSGAGSAPALGNIQKLFLAGVIPDVLVILASSGDDGSPTIATESAAQHRMTEVLRLCQLNHVRPIVCTAPPVNGYATGPGSPDALRKTQNVWARNLRNFGIEVLDLDAIYVDPADPGQHTMNPIWSPIGLHANDAGQVVSAAALAAML